MRYSSVNYWYRVQEVLDGLEGTSAHDVQIELLRHLSSSHIRKFTVDGGTVSAHPIQGDPMLWKFRTNDAAESFVQVVCDWFKTQHVHVPI